MRCGRSRSPAASAAGRSMIQVEDDSPSAPMAPEPRERPRRMIRSHLDPAVAQSDDGADLDRLVRRAVAAHQDGALAQADRLYRAVLARDPHHVDALHRIGSLSFQRGRLADALRFLAAAVRRNARSAEALSDLGIAQHAAEQYADALASHDAALALEPGNPTYINRRAAALLRLGRATEALGELDRILGAGPAPPDPPGACAAPARSPRRGGRRSAARGRAAPGFRRGAFRARHGAARPRRLRQRLGRIRMALGDRRLRAEPARLHVAAVDRRAKARRPDRAAAMRAGAWRHGPLYRT